MKGVFEKYGVKCSKCFSMQTIDGLTGKCKDGEEPSGAVKGEGCGGATDTEEVKTV